LYKGNILGLFESKRADAATTTQASAFLGLRTNTPLSTPNAWANAAQTRIGFREVALIGEATRACDHGK
jgi:hypothetical protein